MWLCPLNRSLGEGCSSWGRVLSPRRAHVKGGLLAGCARGLSGVSGGRWHWTTPTRFL